jgi:glycopeptide antibiotics resistance protein
MIDFEWIYIAPFLALFLPFQYWRGIRGCELFYHTVLLVYTLLLLSITLLPLPIHGLNDFVDSGFTWNWMPFGSIFEMSKNLEMWNLLRQVGGNVVLYIPMGFMLPALFFSFKRFSVTLLAGLLSSIGIELLQFIISLQIGFSYKVSDIDDVILNTFGCLIGYFCWRACLLHPTMQET